MDSQKTNWAITKVFLADYFGVSRPTLDSWLNEYEQKNGKPLDLKDGKAVLDWVVERKSGKRLVGVYDTSKMTSEQIYDDVMRKVERK